MVERHSCLSVRKNLIWLQNTSAFVCVHSLNKENSSKTLSRPSELFTLKLTSSQNGCPLNMGYSLSCRVCLSALLKLTNHEVKPCWFDLCKNRCVRITVFGFGKNVSEYFIARSSDLPEPHRYREFSRQKSEKFPDGTQLKMYEKEAILIYNSQLPA